MKYFILLGIIISSTMMACAQVAKKEAPSENINSQIGVPTLVGWYQQDSYLENDPISISIEINEKTFVAYGKGMRKDKKTGKEILDTHTAAEGDWILKDSLLTFKTKAGSCVYTYDAKTQISTPPTVGRGFKFVSKSGANTNFCRKVFSDIKSKPIE